MKSTDDRPPSGGRALSATTSRGALALAGDHYLAPLRASLAKYERVREVAEDFDWGIWLGEPLPVFDDVKRIAREHADQLTELERRAPALLAYLDGLGREVAAILKALPPYREEDDNNHGWAARVKLNQAINEKLGAKLSATVADCGAPYNLVVNRVAAVAETAAGVSGEDICMWLGDVLRKRKEFVEEPRFECDEYLPMGDRVNTLSGLEYLGRGRFNLGAEWLRAIGLDPGSTVDREIAHSVIGQVLAGCSIWKDDKYVRVDNQLVRQVCGAIERDHRVFSQPDDDKPREDAGQRAPWTGGDVLDLRAEPAAPAAPPSSPEEQMFAERLEVVQGAEASRDDVRKDFGWAKGHPDDGRRWLRLRAWIEAQGRAQGVVYREVRRRLVPGGPQVSHLVGVRLRKRGG